jgi:hypothetical protein
MIYIYRHDTTNTYISTRRIHIYQTLHKLNCVRSILHLAHSPMRMSYIPSCVWSQVVDKVEPLLLCTALQHVVELHSTHRVACIILIPEQVPERYTVAAPFKNIQ